MSLSRRVSLEPEDFINQAIDIVSKAQSKNLILRILGAAAIYIHSRDKPEALSIFFDLGRFEDKESLFTDLDLIGYSKQRKEIIDFFERDLGFKYDPYVKALFGAKRLVYYHPSDYYHVDIFFDKLEFSHDIVFGEKPGKGRLELDFPTITLADLVLEKLQIHEINRKDLVDLAVLFYGHPLCSETSNKKDCIDDDYIATVLSDDWGFWYDATNNLAKLKYFITSNINLLREERSRIILERIDKLLTIINNKPKSKNWIKRSKIGASKPWYREVEEIER